LFFYGFVVDMGCVVHPRDGLGAYHLPRVKKEQPTAPLVTITTAPQEQPAEPEEVKPQEERSPTWFWDLINSFQKDDWGKVYDVWLVRRGDSKVPYAPGAKGFLDQFMEPINPIFIKQKYGGGLYRAVLRKNGTLKTSHDFEIEGNPVYQVTERPGDAHRNSGNGGGNESQLAQQFISVLRDELQKSREASQASPATDNAIEMMAKAAEKSMDMVRSNVPAGSDPAAQVNALLGAAEKLANLKNGNAFDLGDFLNKLLANPLIAPIITRLITPPDPLAELAKLGGALEAIEKIRGGGNGAGGRGDWRSVLAEKAVEALPQVLDTVKQNREASLKVAEEQRTAAEIRDRTAQTVKELRSQPPPPPAAPSSATPPASTVTPMRTVPLNGTAPSETPAPANGQTANTDDLVADWIKQRIVAGVQLGTDPEAIVDFLDVADPSVCDQLVAYPAEVVTGFLQNDPILHAAVTHPNWPAFFAAARAYILSDEPEPAAKPN
jgi:hypothetical protein